MKAKGLTLLELLVIILVIAGLLYLLSPAISRIRGTATRHMCGSNLSALGKAMLIYASENDGKYPTPSRWCDLLIEHTNVTEKQFVCPGALRQKDKSRCHYAMNPNCEPNSSPDLVLLFDSKGGWNQFGELELMTFENHKGPSCVVLYNDGHLALESLTSIPKLMWKDD